MSSIRIPHKTNRRFFAIAAIAFTLWWSSPLWFNPSETGKFDWGIMLNAWEVRWKTIFEFHQMPALDPWQAGGVPVNPGLGYFSIQAICTAAFGVKIGLDAFILFYLFLGLWGLWKLAEILFPENQHAAPLLASLGVAGPALAMHLAVGHLIFANFFVWPAIFALILEATSDNWSGLKAGLLFALGFNELPYYIMQYGALFAFALFLWKFLTVLPEGRRRLLRFSMLLVLTAVPFLIPSLVAILTVARDYARVANTLVSVPISTLLRWYFLPKSELGKSLFVPAINGWWGSWETNCYVGLVSSICFFVGLVLRPRWFHLFAAIGFLFTVGNLYWWQPMTWLMLTPVFASLQSFMRLRLFTYLFFTISAVWGWVLASIRLRAFVSQCTTGYIMAVIAAFMIVDVGNVAHRISLQSHIAGSPTVVINDQLGHYYQLAHRKRDRAEFDGWPANLMEYTRANIGIVREGVDSEFREYAQGHLRIHPRDEVNYVGEFSQHGTPVTPAYWSPNHIKFDDLDPNVPLLVNLNRGSPWFNFGRQLYPNDKIVNFVDPFIVMPDVKGRVDLWYISPHTDAAWFATALGVAVLSVSCLILHRSDKSNDPTP